MQTQDQELLSRRTFIKFGTAGLALSGNGRGFGQALPEATAASRKAPANPLSVQSRSLEMVFDPEDSLPYEYRLVQTNVRFAGETFGETLKASVYCKEPRGFASVSIKPQSHKVVGSSVEFRYTAMYAPNAAAADFSLRYSINDKT